MNRISAHTLVFMILPVLAIAQNTEEEFIANYNARISKERINDVYIPKDLDDAMKELDRLTDDRTANNLLTSPEDTIASKLHFSLGRWMSIHWGFEEGSRLSHYLKGKGVTHPDDMMDLLIRSWYRHLSKQNRNEEQLIKRYRDHRKQEYLKNFKQIDTLQIKTIKK